MRKLTLACLIGALSAPACADTYPVHGRFGASAWTEKGPIDCAGRRIVTFGDTWRRDTGGGVSTFVNVSVERTGPRQFAVVDTFTTGQIYYAKAYYDLYLVDEDRVVLDLDPGGVLKLQRCK